MSADANKAIVRRFIEAAMNPRNPAALGEVCAADLVWHGAGGFPDVHGLADFTQVLHAFVAAFPDVLVTIDDLLAEGDQVAGRYTVRATHQGPLMGLPATGKSVTFGGISIYRIAEGKIAEEWFGDDIMSLMQQLGAVPAPGQPGT
jgi:steroid delta-isomerase-like uncharacterized protein